MHAEILAFGDEITSGQVLDTNSQWLSQRLGELGIEVIRHTTVGDQLDAGAAAFARAIDEADVVVSTGGLGPTADDLAREALARATGRPLVRNEAALEHIRSLFARRGRPMSPRNELQALFPEGSRMIRNAEGTAPGIAMAIDRPGRGLCRVFALPGVPAELKPMWEEFVRAALVEAGAGRRVILRRRINCFGAGESQIEAMLPDLIRRDRIPRVGITASRTTITLRITAEGADRTECQRLIEPTVATIYQCLGDLVFGEEDEQLQDVVVRLLGRQDKTLAVAEWGTAGRVSRWLASAAGDTGRFVGGIVVGHERSLLGGLDVPGELIEAHSPTSAAVAEAMAQGARRRFDADCALAVSRFPDPSPGEPALFYLAWATGEGVRGQAVPLAGHPAMLSIAAAKHALNLARLELGVR